MQSSVTTASKIHEILVQVNQDEKESHGFCFCAPLTQQFGNGFRRLFFEAPTGQRYSCRFKETVCVCGIVSYARLSGIFTALKGATKYNRQKHVLTHIGTENKTQFTQTTPNMAKKLHCYFTLIRPRYAELFITEVTVGVIHLLLLGY